MVVDRRKKWYIRGIEKKAPLKQRALNQIGKVLVNFGNLTFASLVLGTIIKGDYDHLTLLLIGGGASVFFIAWGVVMLTYAGGEK